MSIQVAKSRIIEAACRTDFMSFVQWAFQVLEPGSTLNLNWHHYAIAYYLELVRRGVIKRLIIVAPPRTLKSLMASVAFPAWVLGHDPTARIIGISHGSDLQIKFSNDFRTLVENPRYRILFPTMELAKNTETEVHTSRGGYRFARSAEGSLTGIGGRFLILDDYQKPLDVTSEARRTATNSLYYTTIASRIDNQHSGAIVVVGQRLHPDDLIGTLLRSAEPWTVLCLPAIAEKEDRIPIGPGRCHVRKIDELLHPQQLRRGYLESLRFQDREIYLAQYQQSPIPPGGFIIKRDHIQYCDELPPRSSATPYLQTWDTARKPGEANSRSACLDILIRENKYFIARALVGQWDYDDLERRALWRANEGKPNAILVEDDGGFGTVTLDGRVEATGAVFEAKFMLPWSFSEEAAAEKYMPQLQHNMWVVAAGSAVLSVITGGGRWVEITTHADPLYQHLIVTAERKFWRCVEGGEPPRLFGVEPPKPRIEAVRVVDMSASNAWAEFAGIFRSTRQAFLEHERAKTELKALVPEDAKEAIGHGVRAKRSKSGAISFDLQELEGNHAAL